MTTRDRSLVPFGTVARTYGLAPEPFKRDFRPAWDEYMHYLYLPVVMGEYGSIRLPQNIEWIRPVVEAVCLAEFDADAWDNRYVYVTARRGYATPGNPLNRPGWHADGFGTNDINFIWADRWPTRFALGEFTDISIDHVISAEQFEEQVTFEQRMASRGVAKIRVEDGVPFTIYRLDPSVVHATPVIPPPGGDRSFFKISVSPDRYNLLGNSHNHLFDYDWKMWSRSEVRNDPAYAGGDSGPQEAT